MSRLPEAVRQGQDQGWAWCRPSSGLISSALAVGNWASYFDSAWNKLDQNLCILSLGSKDWGNKVEILNQKSLSFCINHINLSWTDLSKLFLEDCCEWVVNFLCYFFLKYKQKSLSGTPMDGGLFLCLWASRWWACTRMGNEIVDLGSLVCVAIKSFLFYCFRELPKVLFMCFLQIPFPQSYSVFTIKL